MDYRRFRISRFWSHLISMPFIWAPLVAVLFLDFMTSLYQFICFPLYKLEKVKRREYILINDRARLDYLNLPEKLSCMYCGYVNGFLLYAKEIAGRTEKYWCGIMHDEKHGFKPHVDQAERDFSRFGDKEDFYRKYGDNQENH